jgi:hypothetical protein
MSAAGDLFRAMAERIERQAEGDFAGAMLLVPPGEGEPLQVLLADPEQKPEHFWNIAKVRVDIALGNLVDEQRRAEMSPYGGRR